MSTHPQKRKKRPVQKCTGRSGRSLDRDVNAAAVRTPESSVSDVGVGPESADNLVVAIWAQGCDLCAVNRSRADYITSYLTRQGVRYCVLPPYAPHVQKLLPPPRLKTVVRQAAVLWPRRKNIFNVSEGAVLVADGVAIDDDRAIGRSDRHIVRYLDGLLHRL